VRKRYQAIDSLIGDDDVIDICVSYDRSWMTRGRGGHVSNIGLGAVVEVTSGLVFDFEDMSKYCHLPRLV
jgi:hypothetical protein